MCLDLSVKEASQLKCQLLLDCLPVNCLHHTRLEDGVDAGTVAAAVKILTSKFGTYGTGRTIRWPTTGPSPLELLRSPKVALSFPLE